MKKKQLAILASILVLFILFAIAQIRPFYRLLTQTVGVSPFQLLFNQPSPDTTDGRTNILILGKPDIVSYGPNLTDSIIFLSYDHEQNKAIMIGLPRDIWSPTLQDKINSAYAYGEEQKEGGGPELAKTEIEALLNKPIHYTAVITFSHFEELIDALGGVEVQVENSFRDTQFPILGKEEDECFGDLNYECRYQTVSFEKGLTLMDGETALQFVRSRNAEGEEGSDFARNKRQQLVIQAIQQKLITVAKEADAKKMAELYQIIDSLVKRDISNQAAAVFAKNVVLKGNFRLNEAQLEREFYIVPPLEEYQGKYVLIPSDNTLLNKYISCIYEKLNTEDCSSFKERATQE